MNDYPEGTYDDYVERGESENRTKEIKCGLAMDRLSDQRFLANLFRLNLHALAMNLLVRWRRLVAEPLPAEPERGASVPVAGAGVPAAAQTGAERRRQFREHRRRDPLGEGHPCTWRVLIIKVAAEVVVSVRRVVVRWSSSWPHLGWYRRVCERLRGVAVVAPVFG